MTVLYVVPTIDLKLPLPWLSDCTEMLALLTVTV